VQLNTWITGWGLVAQALMLIDSYLCEYVGDRETMGRQLFSLKS